MKRFIALLITICLSISTYIPVFADNTIDGNPTSAETPIVYEGSGTQQYSITVPAKLSPGESGTVTVNGTWASNKAVKVDVPDKTVTLTNSGSDIKEVTVTFDTISQLGSNTETVSSTQQISISGISDALFGVWTGTVTFNADMVDIISFTLDVDDTIYKAEEGMTWEEWINSSYNTFENGMYILEDNSIRQGRFGYTRLGHIETESLVYSTDTIIRDGEYTLGMAPNPMP